MKSKNKTISIETIEMLADRAIYKTAEEENLELGFALKNIREDELLEVLSPSREFRKKEAHGWRIGQYYEPCDRNKTRVYSVGKLPHSGDRRNKTAWIAIVIVLAVVFLVLYALLS